MSGFWGSLTAAISRLSDAIFQSFSLIALSPASYSAFGIDDEPMSPIGHAENEMASEAETPTPNTVRNVRRIARVLSPPAVGDPLMASTRDTDTAGSHPSDNRSTNDYRRIPRRRGGCRGARAVSTAAARRSADDIDRANRNRRRSL